MNEKIKEIAIFDVLTSAHNGVHRDPANYLTDLNALHRVALDLMDRLTELFNTPMDGDVFIHASDLEYNIKRSCYTRPINGQYTDLVDAVYEAIVYLKQHNQ